MQDKNEEVILSFLLSMFILAFIVPLTFIFILPFFQIILLR